MGSGTSLVVNQVPVRDAHFKELLSSRAARSDLFLKISEHGKKEGGTSGLKGKISLINLVGYFTDPENALFPGFDVNVEILSEAYKFTADYAGSKGRNKSMKVQKKKKNNKKKSKEKAKEEQLTLKKFHRFLPILLVFDRLWDVFDVADKVVCADTRVFMGEFKVISKRLETLCDITILGDFTQESWEAEFKILDKNHDGYIVFHEFCLYVVSHIKKPFDFVETELEEDDSSDEEDDFGAASPSYSPPLTTILSANVPAADAPAADDLAADAPAADAPAADAPAADVPAADVPTSDAPAADAPAADAPAADAPAADAPAADAPAADAPAADAPAADVPTSEMPAAAE